mgnify:CR=1 FL=1
MTAPVIREAVEADRPALAALQAASWRDAYAAILPADCLAAPLAAELAILWRTRPLGPPNLVLIAETPRAAPAAFIAVLDLSSPSPLIDNLHTRPDQRSRGLGAALMAEAARRLIAHGRTTAHLTVAEANPRARAFYARLGGTEGPVETSTHGGHPMRSLRVDLDLRALAPR